MPKVGLQCKSTPDSYKNEKKMPQVNPCATYGPDLSHLGSAWIKHLLDIFLFHGKLEILEEVEAFSDE